MAAQFKHNYKEFGAEAVARVQVRHIPSDDVKRIIED